MILRRPSGLEAYPGDIFYLHSRLLEQMCIRDSIHDALTIKRNDGRILVVEVQQHIGEDTVRTVAMDSTDGDVYKRQHER